MPRARPRSRILTFGKMDPIHSAAPICGWSAGPRGIGSARRSVSCRPTWSCVPVTVSVPTGLCPILISRHGTTQPNPNLACRVTTTTCSARCDKDRIPCRDCLPLSGDRLMEQIAGRFGFKVRVSPQARNSQPYDGRPACCASSSCIPISPVQAKYDATVHLRKAADAGARILSDSVAVRVDVGPDRLATGILIRRPDRSETWLGTRHLIIAANAIEGPKLLLMSRSERFPNGVANSSDAVGRYLMDHPVQLTRALSPVPVWQRRGPQEVSAIHEMRDGHHRRQHGAFLINIGNQGWEWAGPDLATLAKGFVEAGLSGTELLNAIRSHSSREMTLVALTEQLPRSGKPNKTRLRPP